MSRNRLADVLADAENDVDIMQIDDRELNAAGLRLQRAQSFLYSSLQGMIQNRINQRVLAIVKESYRILILTIFNILVYSKELKSPYAQE
jgi:hypothetical protein